MGETLEPREEHTRGASISDLVDSNSNSVTQ